VTNASGYKLAGAMAAALRDNPSTPISSALLGMKFQVAALLEYGRSIGRVSRRGRALEQADHQQSGEKPS